MRFTSFTCTGFDVQFFFSPTVCKPIQGANRTVLLFQTNARTFIYLFYFFWSYRACQSCNGSPRCSPKNIRAPLPSHPTVNSVRRSCEFEKHRHIQLLIVARIRKYHRVGVVFVQIRRAERCWPPGSGTRYQRPTSRYRDDYSEDAGWNLIGNEGNTFTDFERSAFIYIIQPS